MRDITIYCSARDQEVSVLVDHDPLREGESSVLDTQLYCLEIGRTCSGVSCPLGAEPPTPLDRLWLSRLPSSRSPSSRRAIRWDARPEEIS